ncbi:hypothetical protein [Gordonia lacunae]|uniref:hypothetical protein n=1 Tax=Gordonia lacunae TaxID=417102 RepID=UPI001FC95E85|nr:hypothetical protein [Gordonia lacunae]
MRARAMARLLLMSVLVVGVPAAATTGSPDAWAEPGGSVDSGSLDGVDPRDLDYGSLGGVDPRDLDFVGSIGGGVQPPRVQQCDEETRSGGRGVTETRYMLGRPGPTRFTLRYDTLDQADEIRVFYQGRLIHNTGYVGDNRNEGAGSARVVVPRGTESSVVVRVTGPEEGTRWEYTVYCPGSS